MAMTAAGRVPLVVAASSGEAARGGGPERGVARLARPTKASRATACGCAGEPAAASRSSERRGPSSPGQRPPTAPGIARVPAQQIEEVACGRSRTLAGRCTAAAMVRPARHGTASGAAAAARGAAGVAGEAGGWRCCGARQGKQEGEETGSEREWLCHSAAAAAPWGAGHSLGFEMGHQRGPPGPRRPHARLGPQGRS